MLKRKTEGHITHFKQMESQSSDQTQQCPQILQHWRWWHCNTIHFQIVIRPPHVTYLPVPGTVSASFSSASCLLSQHIRHLHQKPLQIGYIWLCCVAGAAASSPALQWKERHMATSVWGCQSCDKKARDVCDLMEPESQTYIPWDGKCRMESCFRRTCSRRAGRDSCSSLLPSQWKVGMEMHSRKKCISSYYG